MASTFEVLTDAVRAQLADPHVEWGSDALDLDNSLGRPPRVVWIHRGGTIEAPQARQDFEGVIDGKPVRARHFEDNVARVWMHWWERDRERFERLHNRLLSAVRQVFGTGSRPAEYQIDTQEARASIGNLGHAGYQVFTWRLRVCEFSTQSKNELGTYVPVRGLVTILNQTHSCSLLPAVDP